MGTHQKVGTKELGHIQQWIKDYQWNKCPDSSKGDYIGPWSLFNEKGSLSIKREIKFKSGKPRQTWQRLKKSFYENLLTNQKELENLIIFLNGEDPSEVRALRKYKIKNAYLPRTLIEEFIHESIDNFNNTDKKDIEVRLEAFRLYGIEWLSRKNPNPQKWKQYEKEWGKCLLNIQDLIPDEDRIFPRGELRSRNTLKRVIWLVNHFLEFLYNKNPLKFSHIVLNPITKVDFSKLEQMRKSKGMTRDRKHINPGHWKIIQKHIKNDIDLSAIELCYEFGLRRNEALAINKDSLYKDNLFIDKQISGDSFRDKTKLPKNYAQRRVPYKVSKIWEETLLKIASNNSKSSASPKKVNEKWRALMKKLGFDYDIHDCRHSFTRRMLLEERYSIKEVMEFCGHNSVSTTDKYLRSKTEYSNEKLKAASV